MRVIIFIWSFASFIFFKASTAIFFSEDISTFSGLLVTIAMAITLFALSRSYALRLSEKNLRRVLQQTVRPFLIHAIIYLIVSYTIIYGFSERLYSWLDQDLGAWLMLSILILSPLLMHYFMVLLSQSSGGKLEQTEEHVQSLGFELTDYGRYFLQAVSFDHPLGTALTLITVTVAQEIKVNIDNAEELIIINHRGMQVLQRMKELKDAQLMSENEWRHYSTIISELIFPSQETEHRVQRILEEIISDEPLAMWN